MRTAKLGLMLALVLAAGDQVQRAASGTESVQAARVIGVIQAMDAAITVPAGVGPLPNKEE